MTGLVAIFIILLVVIIVINIKGIGKTFSNTDFRKFEINEKDKYIKIGDKICKFSDITSVSVNECEEQVTALETIFSRYNYPRYFAEICLKKMDGECIKYNTITKSQVFKILKRLQPYVKLEDSPEYYKEPFVDGVTLFALLLFIIYLALKFMFNVGI